MNFQAGLESQAKSADPWVQGSVTREMTSSELKFALLLEKTLNCLPEPSMRQMVVEALSILSFLANLQNSSIGWIIDVDEIIRRAKQIFKADQEIERIKSSPNGSILLSLLFRLRNFASFYQNLDRLTVLVM